MNVATPHLGKPRIGHSACPHDCPSTCALDVEIGADGRMGRVKGSADNSYTAGVICAKVARYAERLYHPDRLMKPMIRKAGAASVVAVADVAAGLAQARLESRPGDRVLVFGSFLTVGPALAALGAGP